MPASVRTLGILLALCVWGSIVSAQSRDQPLEIHIPAGSLADSLEKLGEQSGLQIIYQSAVAQGIKVAAVNGTMTASDALTKLTAHTGLRADRVNEKTVVLRAAEAKKDLPDTSKEEKQKPADPQVQAHETTELTEVIVTAQKRVQNLIDVPLSVTALNAEALQMSGADTVQSLTYSVPSLVVEETGGGFQSYFLRGIANSNSSTSLVGVYLDEADITTNANSQLGLRAIDLQRVEVLKGPQGTLYGAGSAGGTIRFITRDPNLVSFSGSGDLQLYSTRYGAPSEEFSGVVNLPLVQDRLGVRVVGTYGNLGGWIDQPATGRSNINNQDLRDVRVKTLWTPLDALSLRALVEINRNSGDGTNAGIDSHYVLNLPADPTARTPFTANFNIYNLTGNYDFPQVSLLSSTTYLTSFAQAVSGLRYPVSDPPDPLFEFLNDPDTRKTHSFSQELRVSSTGPAPWHWVAGLFYKELAIDYTTDYIGGQPGLYSFTGSLLRDETSKSASAFADGSYDLTQQWQVGGGVRYFRDRRTLFDGDTTRAATFHHVDPRLYASFAPIKDIHFYASVADGFRSGGFNASGPPESYQPEKVRSYELGAKTSLFERRVSAEVALYFSRYADIQLFRLGSDGLGTLDNAGTAHVKGVDWSFDWQATEHLLLSFSGNAMRARLVSLLPGVAAVQVGDPVDYSMDYSGRLAGTYAWNLTDKIPAFVHVELSKVGPAHATDRSLGGPPVLFTTDVINMLDARLGVAYSGWSYELFGENLANANGQQDTSGAFGFASRPRPRTIGIQVRAQFR